MAASIKKNLVFSIIYQLLNLIVPLITAPYVSRVLGSIGIGTYSYTTSIAGVFSMFVMLGINNYGNREVASLQDDREMRSKAFLSVWSFQWMSGSLVLAVYCFLCYLNRTNELYSCFCIQSMVIIGSILDVSWYFYGMERIQVIVIRNMAIRCVSVFMIFVLVKEASDVWIYVAINAGSALVSSFLILPLLKSDIDFHLPKLSSVLSHTKGILILFLPVIAVSLYRVIDRIMLGQFSDLQQVGLFSNTEKLIDIPMAVVGAITLVLMPRMTALYHAGSQKTASSIMSLSYELIAFLSVGMTVGLIAIANDFVPLFYGNGFERVVDFVYLFAPVILFMSWANILRTQYLIPKRKDKIYVVSLWFGAIVSIATNLILIPSFGASGAIIGTFLAETAVAAYQTIAVIHELPFRQYAASYAKYLAFSAVMFCVIKWMGSFFDNNILRLLSKIAAGASIYCLLTGIYFLKTGFFKPLSTIVTKKSSK